MECVALSLSSNSFSFNIVPPVLFDIDRGQSGEIVLMLYLKGLPLLVSIILPKWYFLLFDPF